MCQGERTAPCPCVPVTPPTSHTHSSSVCTDNPADKALERAAQDEWNLLK